MNLTFPFAVNVMLKLSSKRKGSGERRGTGEVSPLALPHQPLQRLHHKCFLHWAAIKLPDANWPVKIVVGRRKGELQSHEKRHRCGSFLLIQYLIYSIKHRGAYLISNVSDAVFIRGRLVFQITDNTNGKSFEFCITGRCRLHCTKLDRVSYNLRNTRSNRKDADWTSCLLVILPPFN